MALRVVEMPGPDEVTLAEAAELLGVHPNTVRNRIRSGVYEARKVPSGAGPEIYLIKREQLALPAPPAPAPRREVIREALWSSDPRRRRIQAITWVIAVAANIAAWSFAFGRGYEEWLREEREKAPRK